MKVLFVLPRMVSGGVERVTLNLAAAFAQQGVTCRLALRQATGEWMDDAHRVFDAVDIVAADGMRHFVPRLASVIAAWQPTHIITAFTDIGLLTWLARRRSGVSAKLIHGIHNTHAFANRRRGVAGLLRFGADAAMARFLYPRVDALVCVSQGIEAEVKACCPAAAKHTHTIYNPVASAAQIAACAKQSRRTATPIGDRWVIVGLGRLTHQKGFDVLIDAAAQLPASPNWQIDLYGDGPERDNLQQRIAGHRLQDRVTLHGYTDQPHEVLQRADIFVLPSRYEGFGLVIAEAMMHGVQVIAADCPQGPRELLDGGRLGQLVPIDEADALAEALQRVMSVQTWVDATALQARAADFSTEKSAAQWLDLFVQG